jgi:outer membrane protein TolC
MDTITQVVFLYHEVHFAEQRLKIAERSRELAASLVGENERRFRVGSMSEFDVTTARARMAEREEEILFARQAVAARRNALYQLVSDARSAEALANNQLQVAPPPPIGRESTSPAQDFKLALENRPDYQQARLSIQLGRYNRTLRANQLLPEVNFVGSYGYHGFGDTWNQSRDALETRDRRSYSAGAVLRVPLTSAQERGRYRAAKLEVKQAEAQLEMLEQNILIALANAALDIETTRKRVQATTAARELAQQALDAAQKMLRAGSASTFEVLTYQRELAAAEVAEFRARADEQKALAEYDRQIGTTLATWRVQLENPRS